MRVFLLLICIILGNVLMSQSSNDIFIKANEAYVSENYNEAIDAYEKIHAEGNLSADLFLNLGNAYYQLEKYPKAILSFERALKIAPNDQSVLKNISLAKEQLASEIVEVPDFVLLRWWRSFASLLSSSTWAILQLILLMSLCTMMGFYFLKPEISSKYKLLPKIYLLIPVFLITLLTARTAERITQNVTAVVFSETGLMEGPDERSGQLNDLYPGNKVTIIDELEDWYKVKLANQSQGWIQISSVEKI